MTRILIGLTALLLFALPVQAAEVAEPDGVAVTIYNGNLALVRENRTFDLVSGNNRLELVGVSGQLNPDTVHLALDGVEFSLLEQNYDYDLVSSDKLLEKFIGRQIVLVDDARASEMQVTLLSTAGGIVVADSDGRILLNPPGRVVLPAGAADELLLKPTLSWLLWSGAAGSYDGEISYLSGGLDWQADYVVLLNANDSAGDIEGWVTLSNYSGTTYRDAELKLVAGDVNRVQEEMLRSAREEPMMADGAVGGPGGFEEESFFEYHLYDLQRLTTLRNNQQKQIGLLTAPEVPFTKIYEFNGNNGGDVRVMVEFVNEEEAGMGMPLPAGIVRVFKQDSEGSAQFIGEDRIDHTPKDEDVRLYIGNAFDLTGEALQMDYKDLGNGFTASQKITLKNHKEAEDVVITVPFMMWGEWSITASNYDYVRKDAWTAEFKIPVKVDGEAVLEFTYQVLWK